LLSTQVANYLDSTALLCTLSELGDLGFGNNATWYGTDTTAIVYVMSRERDSYIEGTK